MAVETEKSRKSRWSLHKCSSDDCMVTINHKYRCTSLSITPVFNWRITATTYQCLQNT